MITDAGRNIEIGDIVQFNVGVTRMEGKTSVVTAIKSSRRYASGIGVQTTLRKMFYDSSQVMIVSKKDHISDGNEPDNYDGSYSNLATAHRKAIRMSTIIKGYWYLIESGDRFFVHDTCDLQPWDILHGKYYGGKVV
jgi:hypothetical protein